MGFQWWHDSNGSSLQICMFIDSLWWHQLYQSEHVLFQTPWNVNRTCDKFVLVYQESCYPQRWFFNFSKRVILQIIVSKLNMIRKLGKMVGNPSKQPPGRPSKILVTNDNNVFVNSYRQQIFQLRGGFFGSLDIHWLSCYHFWKKKSN